MLTQRAVAQAALNIALAYACAEVHEEGGNNRGDQVEFFQSLMGGSPGDPWCADFACTCLVKGYARVRQLPEDRDRLRLYVPDATRVMMPLSGSVQRLVEGAKLFKLWQPADFVPTAGDLVVYTFSHVGFVRSAFSNGTVHTVEGNTSPGNGGSQTDGDGVFVRDRPLAQVRGYVHWRG